MGEVSADPTANFSLTQDQTVKALFQQVESELNSIPLSAFATRQNNLISLVQSVKPRVAQTRASTASGLITGTASCVASTTTSHIWLTNSHTVRSGGTNAVAVSLLLSDAVVHTASILAWDDDADIAFVTTQFMGITPLTLLPTTQWRDQAQQGSEVFIIGCPFTDKFTVTSGIVSDSGSIPDLFSNVPRTHLIVDCVVRSGNSGGPVVNHSGQIVSVVTYAAETSKDVLDTLSWTVPAWVVQSLLNRVLSGAVGNVSPDWVPEVTFSQAGAPVSGKWYGLDVSVIQSSRPQSIGSKLTAAGHTSNITLLQVEVDGVVYDLGYLDGQYSIHGVETED